jgi:hypothetical protein
MEVVYGPLNPYHNMEAEATNARVDLNKGRSRLASFSH